MLRVDAVRDDRSAGRAHSSLPCARIAAISEP
jgi:hypothetical protein